LITPEEISVEPKRTVTVSIFRELEETESPIPMAKMDDSITLTLLASNGSTIIVFGELTRTLAILAIGETVGFGVLIGTIVFSIIDATAPPFSRNAEYTVVSDWTVLSILSSTPDLNGYQKSNINNAHGNMLTKMFTSQSKDIFSCVDDNIFCIF
jgi:hypothetical protein